MKITCPKCLAEIPAGGVNAEKDFAVCSACGEAFRLSTLIAADGQNTEHVPPEEEPIPLDGEQPDENLLRNPPPGTWVNQDGFNIYIGARTRSPIAFFLVPFTCLWSGGSLYSLYGKQFLSGNFDLVSSLFGLPFLAGSIFLAGFTLMAIMGKIEICLGEASYIFKGVGSLGPRKSFNWDAVTRVYAARPGGRRILHVSITAVPGTNEQPRFEASQPVPAIFLDGNTRIKIGSQFLNKEKRRFLLTALNYFYREKHKTTF